MAQKGKDEDNNTHKSMQKDGEWSGEFSFLFFFGFFFLVLVLIVLFQIHPFTYFIFGLQK